MRLRNCLGMIWSVSTLTRSSGTASEVTVLKGSMLVSCLHGLGDFRPVANIDKVACDGCGRGHFRTYQMGATAAALAAFEVTVAGGSTALAGRENIGIHA